MTTKRSSSESVIEASPPVLAEVLREALAQDTNIESAALFLLDRSIDEGADRKGAWPLLGADALITVLSAKIVAENDDPEPGLRALFGRCIDGP